MPGSRASWKERFNDAFRPADIVRRLVSKAKKRYQKDGFDLDLAYVTTRIVAMGLPALGTEAVYRNPMNQVIKLLNRKHYNSHEHRPYYMIYNLCSEYDYDPSYFEGNVARFPMDDHQVGPLKLMLEFCDHCSKWLDANPKNIVVVHCKAGKGRTGLMICVLLLYLGICATPDEALKLFADKRTLDGQGVTISSQRRFVKYFHLVMQEHGGVPPAKRMVLRSITLKGLPLFRKSGRAEKYTVVIWINDGNGKKSVIVLEPHGHGAKAGIANSDSSGSPQPHTPSDMMIRANASEPDVDSRMSPTVLAFPQRSNSMPNVCKSVATGLCEEDENGEDVGELEVNQLVNREGSRLQSRSPAVSLAASTCHESASQLSNCHTDSGLSLSAIVATSDKHAAPSPKSPKPAPNLSAETTLSHVLNALGLPFQKLSHSFNSRETRFVSCSLEQSGGGDDGPEPSVHVWSDFNTNLVVQGNVKIQVFRTRMTKNKSVGYTWLNTAFLSHDGRLCLATGEIDQQKVKPLSMEIQCEECPEGGGLEGQETSLPQELFEQASPASGKLQQSQTVGSLPGSAKHRDDLRREVLKGINKHD